MIRHIVLSLIILATTALAAYAQVEPYDLTVEYMTSPSGIDATIPRLSWKARTTNTSLRNVEQDAYRILVASSPELLARGKGDLWDSGRVESSQSLNIPYAGTLLQSSDRCYWNVRVWYSTRADLDSPKKSINQVLSQPSSWIMGIMEPGDWRAKWIASEERFRPDFNMGQANWIWTRDVESLEQAPQGTRYFRKTFDQAELLGEKSIDDVDIIMAVTADDEYKIWINGENVHQTWGHFNDPRWVRLVDVTQAIKEGQNLIAAEVLNKETGPTGLILALAVREKGEKEPEKYLVPVQTDASWTAGLKATEGWNSSLDYQGENWQPGRIIGPADSAPWGKLKRQFETVSPAFGKSFNIAKPVRKAILHITGLGFYEASLNGEKIGNKVLDPMPTRYDKRVLYSTYDLTTNVKRGENRLNVLLGHGWYDVRSVAVWNFDNAPWRDFCRMIAQLELTYSDGSREYVLSDSSWDQIESPVLFDCIRQGELSTSLENPNNVIGQAVTVDGPAGRLVAQAVPATVVAEEVKPVKITQPKPGIYVVDFGQNIAGWVRLNIDGQEPGDVVQIKYTERLTEDGNVEIKPINEHFRHRFPFATPPKGEFVNDLFQIDSYLCRTGVGEVYEPRFVYHGFQYVQITGLRNPPTNRNLVACVVQNDFKSVGKFECSNPLLNRIQKATLWSYRGNFVNGVPTDCPHREKNGWTGDAQLACEQAQYNWENTAAYEKWINDLIDEQRPDGNLPGIVPTSGWGYQWGNGPAWDSALIMIPWDLYNYKGDRRILEQAYPAMKKYVDYLHSQRKENGLVDHGLSDWCVAKTTTPAVVTSSVYYYVDTMIVAAVTELLGKSQEAKKYYDRAEAIKNAYFKELGKDDGTIMNGSQTAQSFAMYYAMIDDREYREKVAGKLLEAVAAADNHLDVGILGAKSLFHVLSRINRSDLVIEILNQKTAPGYGDWLERGATTLWEDWKDGSSRNHVMYGDVSTWFYQQLAGIRPYMDPAFKNVEIDPDFPASIEWVRAEHDSPYGLIKSTWRRTGKMVTLNISIPPNTQAVYDGTYVGSGDYRFTIDTTKQRPILPTQTSDSVGSQTPTTQEKPAGYFNEEEENQNQRRSRTRTKPRSSGGFFRGWFE